MLADLNQIHDKMKLLHKFLQMRLKYDLVAITLLIALSSCYPDDNLNVPVNEPDGEELSELDLYIKENFTDKYGMAIRYRFVDRFVSPTQRVTPPKLENVRPMLDFIQQFWIDPFLKVNNGEEFFKRHVPSEIVLLGSPIFNQNGTQTLGVADAGAQITFADVNSIDLEDEEWRDLQFRTVYHEFAHIIHQLYKLPTAFETISPLGYTSRGAWFVLDDNDALERGFTSPYGTSSPDEDFAEIVSFFLFDTDFEEGFMNDEDCGEDTDCLTRNEGREKIRQKLTAISQHYEKVVDIDLDEVREAVQEEILTLQ